MAALKRIRKRAEAVARVQGGTPSSASMQMGQTGWRRQESVIIGYFVRRRDPHVLYSVRGDKFPSFYFVSTTLAPSSYLYLGNRSLVICRTNVPSSPSIDLPIWLHDKSQREGTKMGFPSLFVACRGLVFSDARCGIHFPDAILVQSSHSPNRGLSWYLIYILSPSAISRSNSNSNLYMSTTLIHILWLLDLGKTVFD